MCADLPRGLTLITAIISSLHRVVQCSGSNTQRWWSSFFPIPFPFMISLKTPRFLINNSLQWKDAEMHDVNVLPTNGRDGMKRKCKKPTGSAEMDESCLKLSAGPTFVPRLSAIHYHS
ncbi:uncharacterized protein LOC135163413 isoform X3 [Diachasmimorpha longicaudata]|uniref:uncharacterized protein LOC135163413 isoform X3 n=1 Tax=Diachasmimorpha longicaudata TaxID=58733 RepID=UPI0030B8E464